MLKRHLLPIIFLQSLLLLVPQCNCHDMSECFESFKMAQNEIFPWLREEYHLILKGGNSVWILHQHQRRDAFDGDAEYKKFVQQERGGNNKLSRNGQEVPEVLDASVEKIEELSENNDETMMQLLQDVSNHYRSSNKADSNYIEGRLNTKMSLASEQNALHEIGLKYRHLLDNNKEPKNADVENLLNENQLHDGIESSSNFNSVPEKWSAIDSSLWKRSTGHRQKQHQQHFDDQLSSKQNTLWDESDEKLSKNEQQGLIGQLVPHSRVKRDVINQLNGNKINEYDIMSDDDDAWDFDKDDFSQKPFIQQHVSKSSSSTANREMRDGNEKNLNRKSACNETAVNSDGIAKNDTKMQTSILNNMTMTRSMDKRDVSGSQFVIKGKQRVSDLISGELSNEIVKNAHKMVNSNDILKHYIKPHLSEPSLSVLKDSTKISTNKINSMMKDLVSYINELVDDQIQMRSCIPLTAELHEFYLQLMGRDVDEEMEKEVISDDDNDVERYERFLMPNKLRNKRGIHLHHRDIVEELNEKCSQVKELQSKCINIPLSQTLKRSFFDNISNYIKICDSLKETYKMALSKPKRSTINSNVTPEFSKLYTFRNYILELKMDDL